MTATNGNGNGRLATILYSGLLVYLISLGGAMIYLQVAVASMTSTLSLSTDDRYRKSNAEGDFRLRDAEINSLKERVRDLETFHNVDRRPGR